MLAMLAQEKAHTRRLALRYALGMWRRLHNIAIGRAWRLWAQATEISILEDRLQAATDAVAAFGRMQDVLNPEPGKDQVSALMARMVEQAGRHAAILEELSKKRLNSRDMNRVVQQQMEGRCNRLVSSALGAILVTATLAREGETSRQQKAHAWHRWMHAVVLQRSAVHTAGDARSFYEERLATLGDALRDAKAEVQKLRAQKLHAPELPLVG